MRACAGFVVVLLATRAFADPPCDLFCDEPPNPQPDPLDEARALEGTLDYERALVIVDREIARGAGRAPERLVELHMLAGKLAAGLDHPDVAQAHFARALALSPGVRLPDGTSPKITVPFDAARSTTPPLEISLPGHTGAVMRATVGPDPTQLFWGLRLRGTSTQIVATRGNAIGVAVGWIPSSIEAIDEYGNVIDRASVTPAAATLVPVAPAAEPIYRRWTTWGLAAGGALVIAGIGAARFGAAQDQWTQLENAGGHDYSELASIEARGRDWGLVADIGLGVASATALTAVVMYALHDDRPHAIAPAATATTLGLAIQF